MDLEKLSPMYEEAERLSALIKSISDEPKETEFDRVREALSADGYFTMFDQKRPGKAFMERFTGKPIEKGRVIYRPFSERSFYAVLQAPEGDTYVTYLLYSKL